MSHTEISEDTIGEAKGFAEILVAFNEARSIGTEDVIAAILPLMRQTLALHETGKVAPLFSLDQLLVTDGIICFPNEAACDGKKSKAVLARAPKKDGALKIVDEVDLVLEDTEGVFFNGMKTTATDRNVGEGNSAKPCYLTGHRLWEFESGHHDALTDIFALGLMLGSLATGLDFSDRAQLEKFVGARRDLQRLNGRLHPVLVRAIERMTALERYDRAQDLRSLCDALENYRRIGSDFAGNLSAIDGAADDRDTAILKTLRARLYDTTRRNRLLYHRPIAGELNLTEASVPLVINPNLIKADDLLTGTSKPMADLIAGKEIVLGDWIRFEEMLYAPTVLSRLRLDAMRNEQDIGVSSLRLIPAMMHWYDLRNAPDTPISTPLLLLTVSLKKKKGVRDAFTLQAESAEAQVNPAFAYVLNELYGIRLPESVDLAQPNALHDLFETLRSQVLASEPGISFSFDDKPKRRLLHTTVRRRLDQFQKRQRGNKGRANTPLSDFSYDVRKFKPFGVQLFHSRVRLPEAPFRNIAGRPLPRRFNIAKADGNTTTEKSQVFVQEVAATQGRFDWSFDSSSVILGNYNYQKMSLVRDFDRLTNEPALRGDNFTKLFNKTPRQALETHGADELDLMNVAPSDPSQDMAIRSAMSGQSMIIQGPPGTGKSQTITNLIANFAARNKRALFVCQKRAALDVVQNRLASVGLADLTAPFHDAKIGRAEFVADLDKLYNAWCDQASPKTLDTLERERSSIIERTKSARDLIADYIRCMGPDSDDVAFHELISNALEDGLDFSDGIAQSDFEYKPNLPNTSDWAQWQPVLQQVVPALKRVLGSKSMDGQPEAGLSVALWSDMNFEKSIRAHLRVLHQFIASMKAIESADFDGSGLTLHQAVALIDALKIAKSDMTVELMEVAFGTPEALRNYEARKKALSVAAAQFTKLEKQAAIWTMPLNAEEAQRALDTALAEEGKLLARFTSKNLRSVNALVKARVVQAADQPNLTATQALTVLVEYHKAVQAFDVAGSVFENAYGSFDWEKIDTILTNARPVFSVLTEALRLQLGQLGTQGSAAEAAIDLNGSEILIAANAILLPQRDGTHLVSEVEAGVSALQSVLSRAVSLSHILRPMVGAPDNFWDLLKQPDLDIVSVDQQIFRQALSAHLVKNPQLNGADINTLAAAREQLLSAQAQIDRVNIEMLIGRHRSAFRQAIALSNKTSAGLNAQEKASRERYLTARKILENEFSKSRGHKSARALVREGAGELIALLKPIWLMSPLSVADIVPLQADAFDVVIFDEASQITVEEAIPTCMRATQMIVVGDSKQLPPTQFFSGAGENIDIDDQDHDFELDEDSFLSLSDEKLSGVMLKWHYRSRHEELIAFSNAAFYDNQLLSIPAPQQFDQKLKPIVVEENPDAIPSASVLLDRPLSFHHVAHGIYASRSNEAEANYVAQLVRSFLREQNGMTIGIVAFSEAQQGEIERGLERLSEDDQVFASQLSEEQERVDDGEFVGLFVKNLENVQGDERDIMIVSVCYGPGITGKMRMNLGPINKTGGEKRLNVIFSRAKKRMAIVSSITGDKITNEYNTGAMALRTMLEFAKAQSDGRIADATRALARYGASSSHTSQTLKDDAAVKKVVQLIEQSTGTECAIGVGMSNFVIDVAVLSKASKVADEKPVAFLIDRSPVHHQGEVSSMMTTRAKVLEQFGWHVIVIPLKDILFNQDAVRNILKPIILSTNGK